MQARGRGRGDTGHGFLTGTASALCLLWAAGHASHHQHRDDSLTTAWEDPVALPVQPCPALDPPGQ